MHELSPEFVNALEDKRVKFTAPAVRLPLKGKGISASIAKVSGVLELPGEWLYEGPRGAELKVANVRCDLDKGASIANVNDGTADVRFFTFGVTAENIELGRGEVILKNLKLIYAPEFVGLVNDVLSDDLLTTGMVLGEVRTVISLEADESDIDPVSLSLTG